MYIFVWPGVQQGRLVSSAGLPQQRLQLSQRLADRCLYGRAVHRRPVPPPPTAHVHRHPGQDHRLLPDCREYILQYIIT